MNSQQRILEIARRLLSGEKLTKRELMEEYNKSSSAILRDIVYINETFFSDLEVFTDLLTTGNDRGVYQLKQSFLSKNVKQFTHTEIFAILSILTASRAFEKEEYQALFQKIALLSPEINRIKKELNNDYFEYQGVPHEPLLNKLTFISDLIEKNQGIEFTYFKNGQELTYQRTPFRLFFSDLYFYMATDNHFSEDDTDLQKLNKFRLSSMTDLKAIPKNKELVYSERFKEGELRNSTWLPFYGKELTLIIDFYWDPVYVFDRFPNSRVIHQTDKYTRIEIKANDGWGTKMWLLTQSQAIKVISPRYMADFVIKVLKTALQRYED